jgi:hypothetical protein
VAGAVLHDVLRQIKTRENGPKWQTSKLRKVFVGLGQEAAKFVNIVAGERSPFQSPCVSKRWNASIFSKPSEKVAALSSISCESVNRQYHRGAGSGPT